MKEPTVWIGFVLASFMAVIQSALFPDLFLLAYAPFIALLIMHTSMIQALWLAALGGFCSDLLASDPPGLHTLTAVIACAIIYRFRMGLFKDQPLQLCFYTALISLVTTPLHLVILFLFDRRLPVAGKSVLLDFIEMPLIDAAYAFFWFVGPLLVWQWVRRQWKLWRLKNNESP